MTDTKDNITPSLQTAPAVVAGVQPVSGQNTAAAANCVPEKSVPKVRTWGEYIFDKGTYVGLNYFVNLSIGVTALYFIRNTEKGKQFHGWLTDLSTKALRIEDPKKIKMTSSAIDAGLLVIGGTTVLVPTKYLEDNKREAVCWIEHKIGQPQLDDDGTHLKPHEIDLVTEGKKQTWLNIAKRRILSLGLVIATDVGLNKVYGRDKLTSQIVDFATGTAKKAANVLGKPEWTKSAHNPTIKKVLDIIALDSIFTVISSATVRLTNGATRKEAQKHNEMIDCPPEQSAVSPPKTSASSPESSSAVSEKSSSASNWKSQIKPKGRPDVPAEQYTIQLQREPEAVLTPGH